MDKKYIGKSVALPTDVLQALKEVQQVLTTELGFTPSLSETIAYLARQWKDRGARG